MEPSLAERILSFATCWRVALSVAKHYVMRVLLPVNYRCWESIGDGKHCWSKRSMHYRLNNQNQPTETPRKVARESRHQPEGPDGRSVRVSCHWAVGSGWGRGRTCLLEDGQTCPLFLLADQLTNFGRLLEDSGELVPRAPIHVESPIRAFEGHK